jgi:hypothetical protein
MIEDQEALRRAAASILRVYADRIEKGDLYIHSLNRGPGTCTMINGTFWDCVRSNKRDKFIFSFSVQEREAKK